MRFEPGLFFFVGHGFEFCLDFGFLFFAQFRATVFFGGLLFAGFSVAVGGASGLVGGELSFAYFISRKLK